MILNNAAIATYNTLSRNSYDNPIIRTPLQHGRFEEVYHHHANLLKKTGTKAVKEPGYVYISNTKHKLPDKAGMAIFKFTTCMEDW